MTWNELTQAQRDEVITLMEAVRLWAGQVARLGNLGRAISSAYVGNVENTLAALDAGEIPITNGVQGADLLTKQDVLSLVGYAIDSSSTADGSSGSLNTNYHRSLYAKAAGLLNLLG